MNVSLVMTFKKPSQTDKAFIVRSLNKPLSNQEYDGESTKTIKKNLLKEEDCVIITADSRLLWFQEAIGKENIYCYKNEKLSSIQDCTTIKFRDGHHLQALFDLREFY